MSDINYFFITNYRHGLGGKQEKLEQLVEAFDETHDRAGSLLDRIGFAEGVTKDYRQRIIEVIRKIEASTNQPQSAADWLRNTQNL